MSRLIASITASAVATLAAAHPASAGCPTRSTMSLQQTVADWVAATQPGVAYGLCVVALDSAGHEGFACAGKADATRGLDKDTLFQIGSVTKTMTATLLAKRVAQGTYVLDEDIDPHLPVIFQRGAGDPITLLELATHHSGLPRTPPQYLGPTGDFLQLDTCLDTSCLGSGYRYSNWAFQVLGYTIAMEDGKSYYDDVHDAILAPLAMNATKTYEEYFWNDLTHFVLHVASKHSGNSWTDIGVGPAGSCPTADPSGCLYASPHDMRIWLQYATGLVSPSATFTAARHDLRRSYASAGSATQRQGLAWTFEQDASTSCANVPRTLTPYTRIEKAGTVDGAHAWVEYLQNPLDPDGVSPLGVVLLTNSDVLGGKDLGQLGDELLSKLPMP